MTDELSLCFFKALVSTSTFFLGAAFSFFYGASLVGAETYCVFSTT